LSREVLDRLIDMIEALERVQRLVQGLDFDGFVSQEAVYFASVFSLGIVGEAAKAVPDAVQSQYPSVDWRGMKRLRDLLFHVYFGISDAIIWQIIQEHVPLTLSQLRQIRADHE